MEYKRKKGKWIAALLGTAILTNVSVGAANETAGIAVDDTGTGKVPVMVTRQARVFDVTVPTSLPVSIESDKTVVTASDIGIMNNGSDAVMVNEVRMTALNGWKLAAFNSDQINQLPDNSKNIGFQIMIGGVTLETAASEETTVLSNNLGAQIDVGQRCIVTYDAVIPTRVTELKNEQAANVTMIIGWARDKE